MRPDRRLARPPREIEQEVEAEGREWMRRRLQEKLQAEADRCGEVSPPPASGGWWMQHTDVWTAKLGRTRNVGFPLSTQSDSHTLTKSS